MSNTPILSISSPLHFSGPSHLGGGHASINRPNGGGLSANGLSLSMNQQHLNPLLSSLNGATASFPSSSLDDLLDNNDPFPDELPSLLTSLLAGGKSNGATLSTANGGFDKNGFDNGASSSSSTPSSSAPNSTTSAFSGGLGSVLGGFSSRLGGLGGFYQQGQGQGQGQR